MVPLLHILFFLLLLSPSLAQPNKDIDVLRNFLRQMGAPNSSYPCSKGVVCNFEGGKLVLLVAPGVGLDGPIPSNTLGKFGSLRDLDLSRNNITSLPSDFWGLGNSLRHLDLSANKISGSLPSDLGNLRRLERLDLSSNLLSGSVPVQLESMSSLTHLNLSENRFSGSLPEEILRCSSLTSVDLSSNSLSGNLPSDLGLLWNLSYLNLAENSITGKLPDISRLGSLEQLNLSGNRFTGSISGALRRPLRVVDLSGNRFAGHVSQVAVNSDSWPGLTLLDLSGNQLSGKVFGDLAGARSLRHLSLADNRFSHGRFPELGERSVLEFLNMSRIGLVGKIPASVRKLAKLGVLDLSHNHLEGEIPDLSSNNLKVLDLSSNNLTGEIPMGLQRKLHGMLSFNFSYNNLTFCSSSFPSATLKSSFAGSRDDCPIAVDPADGRVARYGHRRRNVALAVAASAVFLTGLLVCVAFALRRRPGLSMASKQIAGKEDPCVSGPFSFETDSTTWVADVKDANLVPVVIFEKPLLSFTFSDLLAATSHFDRGTLLAEGKFGPVYRGFLPGGFNVAIKVLVHGSTLTDQEAAVEFERLGQIKHPNLVPLTGYCLAGDQRIAVYEYMEHGNLLNLLHDLPLGVQQTDDWSNDTWEDDNDGVRSITSEGQTTWKFRHRIALGTARALAFLHHGCIPQIVHRDVKASSVYLDFSFEPRLSDFGLAKIVGSNFEDEIARVSPGYTPPELAGPEPNPATSKSDVYAFGVVLFELITGKKPVGDEYPDEKEGANLVSWVRALVKKNQAIDAVDPKIFETGEGKQMEEALRIGYLCTADSPSKRPSMQQIVGLLKDIEPGGAAGVAGEI